MERGLLVAGPCHPSANTPRGPHSNHHPPVTARDLKLQGQLVVLAAGIVLAATILFAYRDIGLNGFHFDDWPNIFDNASVQMTQFSLKGLLDAARGSFLPHRPVPSISFAIDWWRGNGTPAPFLLTNLALHVFTGWAVLALLLQTAILVREDGRADVRTILAAGAAAAWWALQPIHVQAVSYAVQRMTVLAALFALICVWAYLRARIAGGTAKIAWAALSFTSLALAALSKENAWITPALVLMAEFLVLRHNKPLVRHNAERLLLALPGLAALVALADIALDGPLSRWGLSGYANRDFTLGERLLTQPKVVLFHVSQILWPLPGRFSLEHDVEIIRSAASWQFWLPLLVILGWCSAGVRFALQPGSRIAGFFMLWIPVTLLIESSVIPLEMIFEHRMYLPSVGIAGLIALAGSQRSSPSLSVAACSLAAVAALFAMWSTQERLPQWRTAISLLENSTRHAPDSVRVWNQLGREYLGGGRPDLALAAISRANAIDPTWGDGFPFVNRGVVLEAMGQTGEASAIYEETIRRFPKQVLGYNNRGLLRLRSGHLESAIQDFDRAIAIDPKYAQCWTNRGTARFLRGDMDAAMADFEKATELSPRESVAFDYLGRIYEARGRTADAAAARDHACRLGIARNCGRNPLTK